ncbi:Uncharacterised protein [Mycobacterium tuberculosis]|uniref:Uncharacterized protein n=1 Tax=Mycobacterium tuberculosis TaxID=1773 RepID=A0A0U0TH43_MYCTX|nr:Uncharacterised protein [Mycobacterium tuberculosis]
MATLGVSVSSAELSPPTAPADSACTVPSPSLSSAVAASSSTSPYALAALRSEVARRCRSLAPAARYSRMLSADNTSCWAAFLAAVSSHGVMGTSVGGSAIGASTSLALFKISC